MADTDEELEAQRNDPKGSGKYYCLGCRLKKKQQGLDTQFWHLRGALGDKSFAGLGYTSTAGELDRLLTLLLSESEKRIADANAERDAAQELAKAEAKSAAERLALLDDLEKDSG